jgi:uncharacterized membrane protein
MTRLRRGFVWSVVGALVFVLVATMLFEGIA